MKWTRIAALAAVTLAAAMTMTMGLTACGGGGDEEVTSSTVSAPEVKAPDHIPFTLPTGFTYNQQYSSVETALYNNTDGIAITYTKEDSSASNLLSAQNNTATQDTTYTKIAAKRPDITELNVSDFSYDVGQGYISYKYLVSFTNRTVQEVNYVYSYTDDKNTHTISVNAPASKADSASQIAGAVRDSFNPAEPEGSETAIMPASTPESSGTESTTA